MLHMLIPWLITENPMQGKTWFCQLFTVEVCVRSPDSPCNIRGGQSGTVHIFSQVLHFAPSIIIPSISNIPASLICSTYNMPTGRHSAKDLSLTRPQKLKDGKKVKGSTCI